MEIQKDIPIPEPSAVRGRKHKYPFREMEIGDSIFVAMTPGEVIQLTRQRACNAARHAFGSGNYKARTVEEPKVGLGVRVWRTG